MRFLALVIFLPASLLTTLHQLRSIITGPIIADDGERIPYSPCATNVVNASVPQYR